MKIKIDVPGWEGFSGEMMGIPFEGGISTRDVTPNEALKMGANIRVVTVEDNEQVGITTVNNGHVEAEMLVPADSTPDPVSDEDNKTPVAIELSEVEDETHFYTKEELEEIANKDGIKPIRDIGNKFGVKGVQIAGLIQEILQAQGSK